MNRYITKPKRTIYAVKVGEWNDAKIWSVRPNGFGGDGPPTMDDRVCIYAPVTVSVPVPGTHGCHSFDAASLRYPYSMWYIRWWRLKRWMLCRLTNKKGAWHGWRG